MTTRRTPVLVLGLGTVLACLAAASATAQASTTSTLLPAGTRALALGNAFPVAGDGPEAALYNPALADSADGVAVAWQRWDEPAAAMSAIVAYSQSGVGVSVAVRTVHHGAAAAAQAGTRAFLAVPQDEAHLFGERGRTASELAATAAVGTELWGVRVGLAATLLEVRHEGLAADARGTTASFDVGVARSFRPFTVGLALLSVGPDMTLRTEVRQPTRVSVSAASRTAPVGPLDVTATARITAWDGGVGAGGGIEVAYWPIVGRTFVARGGIRYAEAGTRPTVGAAFIADALALEYAAELFHEGTTHRVGLVFRP